MKASILIDILRTGDVLGTAPWWHNPVFNFFKLWILRNLRYARENWTKIAPTKLYAVCKRESDLFYAATVKRKWGRSHLKYTSLEKVGRIVYAGRSEKYNTLIEQNRLNADLAELHYMLAVNKSLRTKKVKPMNTKFVVFVMISSDYGWYQMGSFNDYRPSVLDIIDLDHLKEV